MPLVPKKYILRLPLIDNYLLDYMLNNNWQTLLASIASIAGKDCWQGLLASIAVKYYWQALLASITQKVTLLSVNFKLALHLGLS